jgi:hypothetical protein
MEKVKVETEEEKVEMGEEEARMGSGVSGARPSWPVLPVPAWCLLAYRIRRGL